MRKKNYLKRVILWLLMVVMVAGVHPVRAQAAAEESMTIYGIYVDSNSKGDAVLVKSGGEYLLMDLGMYENMPALCDQLDTAGITHFKLYFSHLHIDHVGGKKGDFMAGLKYLQQRGYTIDFLYLEDPQLVPESDDYPEKYELLRTYMNDYYGGDEHIMYLKEGSRFVVGYANVEVLGPSLDYVQTIHPNDYTNKVPDTEAETEYGQSIKMTYYENNCSLVSRISCSGRSYLTSGDMLKVEADYLVKKYGSALKSDIYKLSHHGTALGNTKELLTAINPVYAFAINNGNTSFDGELQQWAFWRSLTSAKPVSMPYYVANEKKTVAYRVADGNISLYQGDTLGSMEKVKGWIAVYGADGFDRQKDYYYIGADGVPLTGVQEIDGNKYYYSDTGCMDYGEYDDIGDYLGWKEYDIWKHRYFTQLEEGGISAMLTGFHWIDGHLYYFDENGWKEEGGDELDFKVIGDHTYAVNEDGIFTTDEVLDFDGLNYYFDKDGVMAVKQKVYRDGNYYYYGKYGTQIYASFVPIGDQTYYFDAEGKMVTGEQVIDNKEYYFDNTGVMAAKQKVQIGDDYYYYGKYGTKVRDALIKVGTDKNYFDAEGRMFGGGELLIGNKEYYFDDAGAMACKQIVKIKSKYYYYGKYGTKAHDALVKVDADKYYFDADGIMARKQFVEIGSKTYYFDKKGHMVRSSLVKDENGNMHYFGKKGTMVTSKTVKIAGQRYTFDENGMLVQQ